MSDGWRKKLRVECLEPRMMLAAPHIVGNTMYVEGTAGDDALAYVANSNRPVRVNGQSYSVPARVRDVVFNGGGGNDTMTAWITGEAALIPHQARLSTGSVEVTVEAAEKIIVHGTPAQSVHFVGSSSADTFVDRETYARMFGTGYNHIAYGFGTATGVSNLDAGDVAWFYNLSGAHVFSGREGLSWSSNASHQARAFGFAKVYAWAAEGEGDLAEFNGGTGDDHFVARPDESRMWGTNFHFVAMRFDKVVARGGPSGNDQADFYDSAGDDTLTAWPIFTRLEGPGYKVEAKAFDRVHAHASAGGHDTAWLHDGDQYDRFESAPHSSSIKGNGAWNIASGFEVVISRSTHGGDDSAVFYGSVGNDEFSWRDGVARLTGAGFDYRALGYTQVQVSADQGGVDRAWLQAASGDRYSAAGSTGTLAGNLNEMVGHTGVEDVTVVWPGPHRTPNLQSVEFTVAMVEHAPGAVLAPGSGVVNPWRVLPLPNNPNRLVVITGEGEQGGPSFVYLLDVETMAPVGDPLRVGSSASDMAWVGGYLVVTARNSAEIFLVDVDNWRVVDRAAVFSEAIALTAMGNSRFAIVSIRVKELQVFRIVAGKLSLERKVTLPGTAYDVTFDGSRNRLYVNQPSLHTISEIDATSWWIVAQHAVGGEPSYGGVIMGRFYVATDRDGFIHFIDRATGSLHKLNLATALGLDGLQAIVRGIDPTDLVVLGSNRLVVINNRQDSLVLEFDSQTSFQTPRVSSRFSGAAFGAGTPSGHILMTIPVLNRIDRVVFDDFGIPMRMPHVVGISPVAAVRIGSGPGATMAVLMSDHRLHLISEFSGVSRTFITIAGYSVSARHPMAADDEGRLWIVVNASNGRRLLGLSAEGTVLHDFAADLASPFSMDAAHGDVVIVDRTNQRIQHVDVASGISQTILLPNQRPGHVRILAPDEWIVIHDTNPHIGVTHSRIGQRTFQPYTGGRWLAGLTLDGQGRPILLDFNGTVIEYDLATRAFRPLAALSVDSTMTVSYHNGRVFVVSPADSSIAIVRQDATSPVTLWTDSGAFDVIPGDGGAWLVTDAGLRWRADYDDAAWWM